MKYIDIQRRLDDITEECLNHIIALILDHNDKIIHFESENAYWISLDDTEDAIKSVTCFILYKDELYFALNDDELERSILLIPELNSLSPESFDKVVDMSLGGCLYKAKDHTDAVEAVDMLHMVECYYNIE